MAWPMLSDRCPVCLSVCHVGHCGPCLLWRNGWMNQDSTWYGGRSRPWPHCVRWESDRPLPKGVQLPPQFSADVCCGQTAGWIKMPLGREVDRGPGEIVLDGEPSPKGHSPPNFPNLRPMYVAAKSLHGSRFHLVPR